MFKAAISAVPDMDYSLNRLRTLQIIQFFKPFQTAENESVREQFQIFTSIIRTEPILPVQKDQQSYQTVTIQFFNRN